MITQFISLPGDLDCVYRLAPAHSAQESHYCTAEFKPEEEPKSLVKLIATMCQTDIFPSQPVLPWLCLPPRPSRHIPYEPEKEPSRGAGQAIWTPTERQSSLPSQPAYAGGRVGMPRAVLERSRTTVKSGQLEAVSFPLVPPRSNPWPRSHFCWNLHPS